MSLLTPELLAVVGDAGQPQSYQVERGAIQRFTEAIGDLNPEYPAVAPPTFLRSLGQAIPALPNDHLVPRVLDGGSAWHYHIAIHPGDTITVITKLASLKEREGRLGAMLIVEYLTTYTNQFDRLVATQMNTLMRMAPTE